MSATAMTAPASSTAPIRGRGSVTYTVGRPSYSQVTVMGLSMYAGPPPEASGGEKCDCGDVQ